MYDREFRAHGRASASTGLNLEVTIGSRHQLTRITRNQEVMGGKPCIREMRVTVGMIVGLVASGYSTAEILKLYLYLEEDDIREALAYAAWRVEEIEVPLAGP